MWKPLGSTQNYHLHPLVKFTSPRMKRCVTWCVSPDVSKYPTAFFFRANQRYLTLMEAQVSEADTPRSPVWRNAQGPQKLQRINFREVHAKECSTITCLSQNHTVVLHLNFCSPCDVKKELSGQTSPMCSIINRIYIYITA